jgi:hypothetical protein
MTLKTKDIIKILKLVKKSKKNKKRKRRNKKVIVTTQQITPSTLQPYEINRQAPQNTIQLDNMRLNNKLLENNLIEYNKNKAKESDDTIKNIQDSISLTSSSISDINNKNMELNDKLNRVIQFGNDFVNQTNRTFDDHQLKLNEMHSTKLKVDDATKTSDPYFIEDIPIIDESQPEMKADSSFDMSTNISKIDNTIEPKPKKLYKSINDINLRAMVKKIELDSDRQLSTDEKDAFKNYYKDNNMKWNNSTKYTKSVLTQLKKII